MYLFCLFGLIAAFIWQGYSNLNESLHHQISFSSLQHFSRCHIQTRQAIAYMHIYAVSHYICGKKYCVHTRTLITRYLIIAHKFYVHISQDIWQLISFYLFPWNKALDMWLLYASCCSVMNNVCDWDKCGICLHHMPAAHSCVACNTTHQFTGVYLRKLKKTHSTVVVGNSTRVGRKFFDHKDVEICLLQ
jgi:hypothetical protein